VSRQATPGFGWTSGLRCWVAAISGPGPSALLLIAEPLRTQGHPAVDWGPHWPSPPPKLEVWPSTGSRHWVPWQRSFLSLLLGRNSLRLQSWFWLDAAASGPCCWVATHSSPCPGWTTAASYPCCWAATVPVPVPIRPRQLVVPTAGSQPALPPESTMSPVATSLKSTASPVTMPEYAAPPVAPLADSEAPPVVRLLESAASPVAPPPESTISLVAPPPESAVTPGTTPLESAASPVTPVHLQPPERPRLCCRPPEWSLLHRLSPILPCLHH